MTSDCFLFQSSWRYLYAPISQEINLFDRIGQLALKNKIEKNLDNGEV